MEGEKSQTDGEHGLKDGQARKRPLAGSSCDRWILRSSLQTGEERQHAARLSLETREMDETGKGICRPVGNYLGRDCSEKAWLLTFLLHRASLS